MRPARPPWVPSRRGGRRGHGACGSASPCRRRCLLPHERYGRVLRLGGVMLLVLACSRGTGLSSIEDAIALAARPHRGQRYPSPEAEPYIFHPLRLMPSFTECLEQMAAFLHDAIRGRRPGSGPFGGGRRKWRFLPASDKYAPLEVPFSCEPWVTKVDVLSRCSGREGERRTPIRARGRGGVLPPTAERRQPDRSSIGAARRWRATLTVRLARRCALEGDPRARCAVRTPRSCGSALRAEVRLGAYPASRD